jgi:hypothetical protein
MNRRNATRVGKPLANSHNHQSLFFVQDLFPPGGFGGSCQVKQAVRKAGDRT